MTPTTRTPLSPIQRKKLLELVTAVHGIAGDPAAAKLDTLFREEFQVNLGDASYEQGARMTGKLLQELRVRTNTTSAADLKTVTPPLTPEPASTLESEPPAQTAPQPPLAAVITGEASFSWNTLAADGAGWVEQYTIRAATGKELIERVGALKLHLTKQGYMPATRSGGARGETRAAQTENAADVPLCAIHKTPMVKRGKDGKSWWSCTSKLDDGQWCNYRPR